MLDRFDITPMASVWALRRGRRMGFEVRDVLSDRRKHQNGYMSARG